MFKRVYSEDISGAYMPIRGGKDTDKGYWHVWNATGALQVLGLNEHEEVLEKEPNGEFVINFANTSQAVIKPTDDLYRALLRLSENFVVCIFPSFMSQYLRWDCEKGPHQFDAIRIMTREGYKAYAQAGDDLRKKRAKEYNLPVDASWSNILEKHAEVKGQWKGAFLTDEYRDLRRESIRFPTLEDANT